MSALGQKQTCALQNVMSALPPIVTSKAKFRKRPCLLYPRKRTCAVQEAMSALGQKRHQKIAMDFRTALIALWEDAKDADSYRRSRDHRSSAKKSPTRPHISRDWFGP